MEEPELKKRFGDAYIQYMSKTPMFMPWRGKSLNKPWWKPGRIYFRKGLGKEIWLSPLPVHTLKEVGKFCSQYVGKSYCESTSLFFQKNHLKKTGIFWHEIESHFYAVFPNNSKQIIPILPVHFLYSDLVFYLLFSIKIPDWQHVTRHGNEYHYLCADCSLWVLVNKGGIWL